VALALRKVVALALSPKSIQGGSNAMAKYKVRSYMFFAGAIILAGAPLE
jgi:hypothetical protein